MRIISGKHKGRKIKAPVIEGIRPTTDFAKTGLFNILSNYVDFNGLVVLDLFSGFGNIAFEFASRGAQFVDAVDVHPQSIKFIKQFTEVIQMPVNAYQSDVLQFLSKCNQKYDVIFADPPYESSDLLDKILETIKKRNLINPHGIIVLEHNEKKVFSSYPNFLDERKYSKVRFSFFKENNT